MLMVVIMYALFDRKLREYGSPLVAKNAPMMFRDLRNAISGSGSMVAKYPEDYDLYSFAQMDTETGKVTVTELVLVENLADILKEGS